MTLCLFGIAVSKGIKRSVKDEVRLMNMENWWQGGKSKAFEKKKLYQCYYFHKKKNLTWIAVGLHRVRGQQLSACSVPPPEIAPYWRLEIFMTVFMTLGFLSTNNYIGINEALYSITMPFECIGHLIVLGLCHVLFERGKIKLQAKPIFRVRFVALFCYLQCRWPPYHFRTNHPYCQLLDEFPSDEI